MTSPQPPSAPSTSNAHAVSPSFVLVHGAWHGGWAWHEVAQGLRAQGFAVFTPTQRGLGERAAELSTDIHIDQFVDDVADLIEQHDLRNVILVGHSFGGNAISGVADRMPERLCQLIYLDAMLPTAGQSVFDTLPPEAVVKLRANADKATGGVALPVPPAKFFGLTDEALGARVVAQCTPHPISTYDTPITLRHPLGHGVPCAYIAVTPHFAATTAGRDWARAQADADAQTEAKGRLPAHASRWTYDEMAGPHDVMVTHAAALTQLLLNFV